MIHDLWRTLFVQLRVFFLFRFYASFVSDFAILANTMS